MLCYIEKSTIKLCESEQRTDHCEIVENFKLLESHNVELELNKVYNSFVDNRDQEYM